MSWFFRFQVSKGLVQSAPSSATPWFGGFYFGQSRFLVGKDIITARACGALAGGSGITPVISTLQDIWQAAIRRIRGQKLALHGPYFGKTFYTFLDCLFCCRSCGKYRVCPSTFPCLQEKSMMSIPKHSSRTDLNDCKQIRTIQNHTWFHCFHILIAQS